MERGTASPRPSRAPANTQEMKLVNEYNNALCIDAGTDTSIHSYAHVRNVEHLEPLFPHTRLIVYM
jgi:hypothetical protein